VVRLSTKTRTALRPDEAAIIRNRENFASPILGFE